MAQALQVHKLEIHESLRNLPLEFDGHLKDMFSQFTWDLLPPTAMIATTKIPIATIKDTRTNLLCCRSDTLRVSNRPFFHSSAVSQPMVFLVSQHLNAFGLTAGCNR